MEDEEVRIRDRIWDELSDSDLEIAKGRSFLFDNIDSFVALSRYDTSVEEVELYPFYIDVENYEFWDKVGQMVGNLMELHTLNIHFDFDGSDEALSPDWETFTLILRYLRRKVALCSYTEDYCTRVEEIQGLARVIHGHPMISEVTSLGCTFETSALGALPWQHFSLWNVLHLVYGSQK
jgi:hypothetical protein